MTDYPNRFVQTLLEDESHLPGRPNRFSGHFNYEITNPSNPPSEFLTDVALRLGNRVFLSPDLTFTDNQLKMQRAMLCVSPQGSRLINQNPGILTALDYGLIELNYRLREIEISTGMRAQKIHQQVESIKLGNYGTLMSMKEGYGGQANRYVFDNKGNKLLVKARKRPTKSVFYGDPSQPYIFEMLQSQILQSEFGEELSECGILLPNYHFASPVLCCKEFIKGTHPSKLTLEQIKMLLKVSSHISKWDKSSDPLWKNIRLDFTHVQTGKLRLDNFIRSPGGLVVFIDPLAYIDEVDLDLI